MRVAFLIIVIVHGLIHSLGFVKAFGLKEIKELTLFISKPMGIIWLLVTVAFLVYGVLYYFNTKQAWIFGLIAVIGSQILVFSFWKDASLGTIPNVLILIAALVNLGAYLMHSEFTGRVKHNFSNNNVLSTDILTVDDMAHLPEIVQKYLHYTKSVGQPKVKNFKAEFIGGMRSNPDDKFMKLHSVQYNFYQDPSRYFYMRAKKMGLPATGLHLYQSKTATFQVKLLNWFKVVNARGDKMNQAETVTLLNDMCVIAPPTLIDKRISWEEMNDTTAKAIFRNGTIEISAVLYFNEKGELVNFISNDRYDTDGNTYENYPWATPLEDYKLINGYLLFSKGTLIYHRPDGDFSYGELEFKSLEYNLDRLED